jgi:hypothetical protein
MGMRSKPVSKPANPPAPKPAETVSEKYLRRIRNVMVAAFVQDGDQALALEREVRAGSLPAGRPYLDPL